MELKPSNFISYPWSSVANNSEQETIAQNIMIIRKRLGDKWELSFPQYSIEREKDGNFGKYIEEKLFNQVYPLVKGPVESIRFCQEWADIAGKQVEGGG